MRLALKSTLRLLVGYAVVLFIIAAVVVYQLLVLQAGVQKETARLFAREVASALTAPSLDRLLHADQAARRDLKTLIESLTQNSQVVTSISVIDRNGRVVASDAHDVGVRLPTPDTVFGGSPQMRFITFGAFPFSSGMYELAVPLVQSDQRVGYLQIGLQSRRVIEMNRRMWNWLFSAAMIGLVCIAGLGFALHVHLARRGHTLAHALEAAIRGESSAAALDLDEFAPALATATRVGQEIRSARSHSPEERGQFVALGHRLDVGVLLLDAAGRLEYASRRGRDLFGCADDSGLATALDGLRSEIGKGLKRAPRANGDGAWTDIELPGGEDARRLRLEFYSLDPGGDGARLVLVRDRAGMKALETDLRLATQLRGLARLYLTVAHDIRAPLAAMMVNLELLGSEGNGSTPPDAEARRQGYLTVLNQELQRLHRTLDSLLNHAALPREDLEEFDLRGLVQDIEGLLRPQSERQKVVLTTAVPGDPVRVHGARDALRQALINLGINALEAMPDGGTLTIRLEAEGTRATLSVVDSGPGIPSDIRDKVFTMHFTTKSSGTGIGLFVARAVVESHGGEIRIAPRAGEGATLQIDLPALSQEA
jgi:signal transduction histidine kinase